MFVVSVTRKLFISPRTHKSSLVGMMDLFGLRRMTHNEVLYKVIYHHLTLGSSIKLIKLLYGEIGIIILIKILNDNTIPIPKDLGKELYSNADDYIKTKKEEKKLEDFFKLLLVVIVILLIIKNFF